MITQDNVWTVKAILDWCEGYLAQHGDVQPRLSAQWLLSEALGLSRIELYTNLDKPLTEAERACMREWVQRRAKGEPLQLISGKAPFRYLSVAVAPGVLIPRPETEVLVSEALKELDLPSTAAHVVTQAASVEKANAVVSAQEAPETMHRKAVQETHTSITVDLSSEITSQETVQEAQLPEVFALDLCTGSGCIACAFASEYPGARVIASDISSDACKLAQKNVDELGLSGRVTVVQNNLMQGMTDLYTDMFDLIISNPPYIPTAVVKTLDAEVANFEPELALDGGEDGLSVMRAFLADAFTCLKPEGVLALELFEDSLQAAADLAQAYGFSQIRIAKDLAGKNRVLIARKSE